ncbi:hypothetical protein SKAU_G00173590 [Synaphobranchus kaupii]|uniref:Uncharacterized protein n=1 Tax=Synaphobranchus kaupii TaxID=118154 RepID=A0A9Q1FLF0_SYNKA|nr:hypothetical protein SKAU_G00173590 [Synaphobranchus kaupii]
MRYCATEIRKWLKVYKNKTLPVTSVSVSLFALLTRLACTWLVSPLVCNTHAGGSTPQGSIGRPRHRLN